MKWQRTYELRVERFRGTVVDGKAVALDPVDHLLLPNQLTLHMDITRAALGVSQTGKFSIYNLASQTREAIHKDQFNGGDWRAISVKAGYEDEPLPLVFLGLIQSCQSSRASGATEVITEIDATDCGYMVAAAESDVKFPAGTSDRDKIATLAKDIPSIKGVVIGDFPTTNPRPASFAGKTWEHIRTLSKGNAWIDNGMLFCLNRNEALNYTLQLNGDNILGSPRRQDALVEVDMLFEPRVATGMVVQLNSSTLDWMNGEWKVYTVKHNGVISQSEGGQLTTSLTLYNAGASLRKINGVPLT